MNKKKSALPALLAVVVCLSACAPTMRVKFDSDPPGATLYLNGSSLGYAPVTLQYEVSEANKQAGYMAIRAPIAKWPSGATAQASNPLYVNFRNSFSQIYTFQRPDSFPGRQIDVQFGFQLQKQRSAEEAQAWQNFQNSLNPPQQQKQEEDPQRMYCNPNGGGGFNCQSY